MSDNWKKALVGPGASVREAMEAMGKSRQHVVMVVDGDGKLLGTVTDGDIRRGILRSLSLEEPIGKIMNQEPFTALAGNGAQARLALMQTNDIQHLPVLDNEGRVAGLCRIEDLLQPEAAEKKNWVGLMAGGLGNRLRPLTEETPKPLLSIGGRPILETIIRGMAEQGFSRIYLSVNYKAEMVKSHFGDGKKLGLEIRYLEETEQLGTAGALGLITQKHDLPLIVMNADLLTKVDFASLLSYHAGHKAAVTVCVREFAMQVPYGVVDLEQNNIRKIDEKPLHTFIGNAGIYVLDPDVLGAIAKNKYLDMPDLLHRLMADGGEVVGYPIHEYWIDIGKMEDFRQAASEFSSIFS